MTYQDNLRPASSMVFGEAVSIEKHCSRRETLFDIWAKWKGYELIRDLGDIIGPISQQSSFITIVLKVVLCFSWATLYSDDWSCFIASKAPLKCVISDGHTPTGVLIWWIYLVGLFKESDMDHSTPVETSHTFKRIVLYERDMLVISCNRRI